MKRINLIYYNNGVGLTKDAFILDNILNKHFDINHVHIDKGECKNADVNIFIQNIDENSIEFLFTANKNVLIPNIEWMSSFCIENLSRFDLIACKSNECKDILLKYNNKTEMVGFSSIDRFLPNIHKEKKFFHLCGKSIQKNTELVVDAFNENKLPITIVDCTGRFLGKTNSNINYINHFLSEDEINQFFNKNLYHVCPSINEGWGHYIYEALSCRSVVIVPNTQPINEFLTNDCSILVNCHNTIDYPDSSYARESYHFPFRKLNYVIKDEFKNKIENIIKYERVIDNSRNKYIELKNKFESNILNLLTLL